MTSFERYIHTFPLDHRRPLFLNTIDNHNPRMEARWERNLYKPGNASFQLSSDATSNARI